MESLERAIEQAPKLLSLDVCTDYLFGKPPSVVHVADEHEEDVSAISSNALRRLRRAQPGFIPLPTACNVPPEAISAHAVGASKLAKIARVVALVAVQLDDCFLTPS